MHINPPDLNSKRARFADWLELLALSNESGEVAISALRTQLRRTTDGRSSPKDFEEDADDGGEPEVTERSSDDLEERVTEEIELRIKLVGSSYPFELISLGAFGSAQILKRKESWKSVESGELIYIFCLLDSGMRDNLIAVPKEKRYFVQQIGNVFQICSCIAVGGYTNAEVVSFGFPRATGDGFLPALTAAWARYGSYKIRDSIPYGFDAKLKDGGVDIIAWRGFSDGHAATLLMFVQVASGMDWKDKPVASDVKSIRQWFVNERFEHFLPAICLPFPLWFDLEEPPRAAGGGPLVYREGVTRKFAVREATFGIIFDRGRIAQSSALALGAPGGPPTNIDGIDRINEVDEWVEGVMQELAEKRAAA
ncbi:hypothetical protein [Aureimonas sp. AU12]|uniref:hypothetical protein n=1 Tax=Aureimonas sp. AU12 TaxID=1638161 RepID=UPI000AD1CABE|nr:hypothetical protein [Aureimonas sp. AU12]